MHHPSDSPSWKLVDHRWPDFASEPRNLRLAILADARGLYIKVVLLWTINDFPAYGNLSGCVVKGYFACPICGEDTFSHRLKHGKKNSYTGHRRFLPCNHPFRKQKKAFNGKTKDGLNSRLDLLEMGLSKVVDVSALDKLQNDLVVTLCLLEKYFPPSFFDIMLHLTIHLVREVRLCGPVYLRWMYPFERFMKVLKGYVRNRNRPEGCIAECYIVEEAIEFCTEYLSNVDAIGIPISANIDQKVGAPIPGGQVVTIDSNLWLHAHHYVLENTTIVQPYIEIPVFKCDWVENKNGIKVDDLGFTLVDFSKIAHKSDHFILASQAKQVFYVQDQLDPRWSVVLSTPQKDFLDMEGGEDFVDNSIEHHPFIGALPQIEAFDVMDDSDATCHGMGCNSHKIVKYILPFEDQLELLKRPPIQYTFIEDEDWIIFVKDRLSDNFKDKLLKESQENGRSVSGSNDILVEALGTPEYSGRVRAKGKHYTPHQYFNSVADRAIRDFIAASKEEQRIFQAEVLAKLSQVGAATPQSDVSSSNMKQKQLLLPEAVDKPIRKVEDVTPPEAIEPQKKVRKFELAIGTKENIVAGGTIILECGPNYLVVVDAPYDSSAPLPIPIPGQTTTVGAAIGYQVLWPTNLVIICTPILASKKAKKQKVNEVEVKSKDLHDERNIEMIISSKEVSSNCILYYIWHLHRKLIDAKQAERYVFVNPALVSKAGMEREARKTGQVALEMKKMIAYYLDPMACQPCDDLKDIGNENQPTGKTENIKEEPTWVKVVCPRQPGSVECGYYVMRYMKEIIANPNQLTSKLVVFSIWIILGVALL
ncbi:hypothetical protein CK203_025580 [Vitis vinifera]|uniref:DUF4218 domain-containing protein n=1 Tax=Vitis vinifera TaxID=29760 RepID=A0A438IEH5_VITVI|nr:hypothetical protein CK203_025580 [Vitis vinifera]